MGERLLDSDLAMCGVRFGAVFAVLQSVDAGLV